MLPQDGGPWAVARTGRDQYCKTPGWPGQVDPAVVEADLGRRLQAVVRACEAVAYNTAAARDEEAVLVRVPPGCSPAVARAASNGLAAI
eukprot:178702-Lingulodinium_polyedra.AAC.1